MYHLVYFGLGLVADFLIAAHYRAISCGRGVLAGILSFFITLLSFYILEMVLVQKKLWLGLAYAVGCGLGTALGTIKGVKSAKSKR